MSPLGDKRPQSTFFYIGGDDVSGTSNLTGAYCFVAMGEVLKKYGVTVHEAGRLMVVCYKRYFDAQSKVIRFIRRPGNALAGKTVHGTTKPDCADNHVSSSVRGAGAADHAKRRERSAPDFQIKIDRGFRKFREKLL